MTYDEIPGIAGRVLRAAERFGLDIRPARFTETGIQSWAIYSGNGPDDALYVNWAKGRTSSGTTRIYRPGRRTALVKITRAEALAVLGTLRDSRTAART